MSNPPNPYSFSCFKCNRTSYFIDVAITECPFCYPLSPALPPPLNQMHHAHALYTEAERVITGPRRESYGNADKAFGLQNYANVVSAILGVPVTAKQMALVMIGCKLCREANKHAQDNLVDICGYTGLLAELEGGK